MNRLTVPMCVLLVASVCVVAPTNTGRKSRSSSGSAATYNLLQRMDVNTRDALNQLNRTTAEISARIDATDSTIRNLRSLSEENQIKLDMLQRSLDSLTVTLYRHLNLTPPQLPPPPVSPVVSVPGTGSGSVLLQPPVVEVVPGAGAAASPADMDAHYKLGQAAYDAGDYEMALRLFAEHGRLYAQSPHTGNAQFWKAHCHMKLGHFENAIEEFTRLRSEYPSSPKVPTAMHNQAVSYSRLGQNERAKSLFRRLIAEYADDAASESAREKLRQLEGL